MGSNLCFKAEEMEFQWFKDLCVDTQFMNSTVGSEYMWILNGL